MFCHRTPPAHYWHPYTARTNRTPPDPMISFRAIEMRDIRHRLSKYPFLGRNECPARFSESVIFYTSRCKDAPLLSQTIIQFVKLAFVFSPPARNRPSGRRWRRRNYSFQHRMSRREGAVPERDDGVCLTTLRDRRAGPVKGGVRRQAPSRLREPLKAVMEPAPPPSRPIPGHLPNRPESLSL